MQLDPLIWSVLLLLLAAVLILLELFIPSGGALGFLSVVAVLAAIVLAFYQGGPLVGTVFLVVTAIVSPLVLFAAVHWWPNTPVGRMILIQLPSRDDEQLSGEEDGDLHHLAGKRGVAKNLMLPSGAVLIDGRTYDAVSEGMSIEVGQEVQVIQVNGNRIVVRPADDEPPTDQKDPDDVLSQPIDTVGLDPFDDPLA